MNETKDKSDFSIFITVHAVERFYERALLRTEEEAKKLTSTERYNIVKMIERILKEEHPTAYELGAGIYKSQDMGVTFVLENHRVLTVTGGEKDGTDRKLRGGALKNGKKYGKMVSKIRANKYKIRREE